MTTHKGWHDRGYLPHFDAEGVVQHVVFRLHGSLPASRLEALKAELDQGDDHRLAVDHELDLCRGPVWLSDPACADIVADALTRFDGVRYELLAWCVMPNHVHVMIHQKAGWPLGALLKSWKSYTARLINRRLGLEGHFWAADYFDRYIRNEHQYAATRLYIEANPVTACLCLAAEDWRWSSAGARASAEVDGARTSTSADADPSADLEVRAP